MGNGAELTVVLADDEPQMRAAVRLLLESEGMRVVAEAATADEAVDACREHRPDLALLDVRMPGGGPAAATAITAEGLAGRVVALSASEDPQVRRDMLAAGADAYVLKASGDDLIEVVRGEPRS